MVALAATLAKVLLCQYFLQSSPAGFASIIAIMIEN
jgi:hypothetical protein